MRWMAGVGLGLAVEQGEAHRGQRRQAGAFAAEHADGRGRVAQAVRRPGEAAQFDAVQKLRKASMSKFTRRMDCIETIKGWGEVSGFRNHPGY
ncbi:hypothetical protein [Massilia agri]|uniref:Uncharacterized protein n=1 Tax=Massilia agri TaxID=1886785 RepID=A0ABT2AJH3_9BURK|nr:hypothetical protein [Massilia agri]MCS0595923.1 hypothetical protein [Massilia agri]